MMKNGRAAPGAYTGPAASHLGVILVTGAGGAAAVTVLNSLTGHAELVAADIDPFAVGLYLVPPERRVLIPRGDDPAFVSTLLQCAIDQGADLVVPTVDTELRGVSAARDEFAGHGIDLLVEEVGTLDLCLDKLRLMQHCAPTVRVPLTVALTSDACRRRSKRLARLSSSNLARAPEGAASPVIHETDDLRDVPLDGTYIAQEMLPGAEFSIDVLGSPDGRVVAAVPRRRDKIDSGIAVAGRTVADPALEAFGRAVASAIGVVGVVNVQAKLDRRESRACWRSTPGSREPCPSPRQPASTCPCWRSGPGGVTRCLTLAPVPRDRRRPPLDRDHRPD